MYTKQAYTLHIAYVHTTRTWAYILFLFMQLKWSPLYAAADAGHMKIVQYLIEERECDSAVVTAVSKHVLNT